MADPLTLHIDPTPNPNSMKITVNRTVSPKPESAFTVEEAARNPLARALFEIPGVASVFLLNNFVTISRTPAVPWETVLPAAEAAVRKHLA